MTWQISASQLIGGVVSQLFGGPISNLWPIFVAPALAALVSDRTARLLPRTPGAWVLAAILIVAPAWVAQGVFNRALSNLDVVHTWRGAIRFWITPFAASCLIAYPIVRAALRQREVARLFRAAAPAGSRLAAAAQRLGLQALELPTGERECLVAGLFKPTVFISRGALAVLSDAELEAALRHERAHVRGHDTVLLFVFSMLRDLAPYGKGGALEAFKLSREAIADREAAAGARPHNHAAALVALARPGARPAAAVLPMARADTLRWRLQILLDSEDGPANLSWGQVTVGTALSLALVATPALQLALGRFVCHGCSAHAGKLLGLFVSC
jgi:beta-lactamase regulating signal transducer with metallopeptidase domain